jgi:hypothetical protein
MLRLRQRGQSTRHYLCTCYSNWTNPATAPAKHNRSPVQEEAQANTLQSRTHPCQPKYHCHGFSEGWGPVVDLCRPQGRVGTHTEVCCVVQRADHCSNKQSHPRDKWQADSSKAATQEHNLPTWRTSSKPTQARQGHTRAQLAESRAHLLQLKAVHTRAAREGNEKFLKEASIDTPPPRQYPSSQPL